MPIHRPFAAEAKAVAVSERHRTRLFWRDRSPARIGFSTRRSIRISEERCFRFRAGSTSWISAAVVRQGGEPIWQRRYRPAAHAEFRPYSWRIFGPAEIPRYWVRSGATASRPWRAAFSRNFPSDQFCIRGLPLLAGLGAFAILELCLRDRCQLSGLIGLAGEPITHPRMHNYWLRQHCYLRAPICAADVARKFAAV